MSSFCPKMKLIIFFLISSVFIVTNAQLTYIYHYCDDLYGNYSSSSNYGDNVKSAVTALASDASTSHYSNHTTGIGEDRVNAFYYCRYDLSLEVCQKCVESTAKYISRCYDSLISYEECTLYYSNLSISSVVENLESIYTLDFGNFNAENEVHFSRYMENLVTRLSTNVTSEFEVSKRYFATTSFKYSSSETVYALAQCNPDLTSSRCKSCLGNGFADFTYNYTSNVYGQFFFPGCRLSYILSSEETPSRPWKFAQMYDDQYGATSVSTGIRRASSTMGLVIASISSVALCLKLFL